jgi:hypothetical protein
MTDLRFLLNDETSEIVDRLLGEFLRECIGKNDMSVVNALLAVAAIMITTHCERTGQNFDEIAAASQKLFKLSLEISSDPGSGRARR